MSRRPLLLLSLILLAAAALQAAANAWTNEPTTGGIICTACGPIR